MASVLSIASQAAIVTRSQKRDAAVALADKSALAGSLQRPLHHDLTWRRIALRANGRISSMPRGWIAL